MKVKDVEICLDCDEVYDGKLDCCPGCGSCSSVFLSNWLAPLPTKQEIDLEVRRQSISSQADRLLLRAKEVGMLGADDPLGVC